MLVEIYTIKWIDMYKLDQVIKRFKTIAQEFPENDIARDYYNIIVGFMLIEHKHKDIVLQCNKPIYHHFQYNLPNRGREYFEFLYNPHHPVRFAVETFTSIEEVKDEVKQFFENRNK
jgi:hypothetical protein